MFPLLNGYVHSAMQDMLFTCGIVLLLLVSPLVHCQSDEDEIIESCIKDTKRFTKTEKKYIDKTPNPFVTPDITGPQNPEINIEAYAVEKRQRVFECITRRTEGLSEISLETNPKYRKLVKKCMSKQSHPKCDPNSKYRTIDGTCNNLLHLKWGVAGFRKSVCEGKPLPNPRVISLKVHPQANRPTQRVTHVLTFFGQLLAHETTDVPVTFIGDKFIECCDDPKDEQHPQCAPIYLPEDDPFYSQFNKTCINFLRGVPCDTCSVGKRIQMDAVTAFIDLSYVYGLSDSSAKDLRENGTGKLWTQIRKAGKLLPPNYMAGFCGSEEEEEYCFLSGDRRVNLSQMVMSFHTIFFRNHNRLVDELRELNPWWNDETLYQEARKINVAMWEVITYKEFLPLLVGPKKMSRYELDIGKPQTCTTYDISMNPTIRVQFNTAAFRLHSLLNGVITDNHTQIGVQRILNTTANVEPIYQDKMASLMEGLCRSPGQKYDRFVTTDMTNYLYRAGQTKYGQDIVSVNIQRGRDIGIPTYTQMVDYLSKGKISMRTFKDLGYFMDNKSIEILKSVYCDVKDIDLWVGLNNERVRDNMLVGPTAAEIIARQFKALKYGDRFYFEHCGNFKKKQLRSLRSVSFASVLCLNTKISAIQKNVFLYPSKKNPVTPCENIPKVDINLWEEKDKGSSSILAGLLG